jgi:hypothetical protein
MKTIGLKAKEAKTKEKPKTDKPAGTNNSNTPPKEPEDKNE